MKRSNGAIEASVRLDSVHAEGKILRLSLEGLYVASEAPVDVGETVQVCIDPTRLSLRIRGVVVRLGAEPERDGFFVRVEEPRDEYVAWYRALLLDE